MVSNNEWYVGVEYFTFHGIVSETFFSFCVCVTVCTCVSSTYVHVYSFSTVDVVFLAASARHVLYYCNPSHLRASRKWLGLVFADSQRTRTEAGSPLFILHFFLCSTSDDGIFLPHSVLTLKLINWWISLMRFDQMLGTSVILLHKLTNTEIIFVSEHKPCLSCF